MPRPHAMLSQSLELKLVFSWAHSGLGMLFNWAKHIWITTLVSNLMCSQALYVHTHCCPSHTSVPWLTVLPRCQSQDEGWLSWSTSGGDGPASSTLDQRPKQLQVGHEKGHDRW